MQNRSGGYPRIRNTGRLPMPFDKDSHSPAIAREPAVRFAPMSRFRCNTRWLRQMLRPIVSLLSFLVGWALFLAWLANHRFPATSSHWGTDLPTLTVIEAWIVPTAIWLFASWWSFRAPRALSAAGLAWRSVLLGLTMMAGAFLVWIALSLARWSIS